MGEKAHSIMYRKRIWSHTMLLTSSMGSREYGAIYHDSSDRAHWNAA